MTVADTIKNIGWLRQPTLDTDPIVASGTTIYKLGKLDRSYDFPKSVGKMKTTFSSGKIPLKVRRFRTALFWGVGFIATNGIWIFMAMGASANTDLTGGLFKHIITRGATLPMLTTRMDSRSGSAAIPKHYLDNKVTGLTIQFDDSQGTGMLVFIVQTIGTKQAAPGFGETENVPVNINDTVHYRRDTNMVFNYDQGGTPVSFLPEFKSISIFIDTITKEDKDNTSIPILSVIDGNSEFGIQISLKRTDSTDFFDDYSDDIEAGTDVAAVDWRFKIYKNATEYILLDMTDVEIKEITINDAQSDSEEDTYEIVGIVTGLAPELVDTLNAAVFFGVA